MKAAGKILRFYRNLIATCIPLFVATGFLMVFKDTYFREMSSVLSYMAIPIIMGYLSGKKCGGDAGGLAGALAASAVVLTGSGSSMTVAILAGSGAGYLYREGIGRLKDKTPAGFEMLVGNLFLAAVGLLTGAVSYLVFLPCVSLVEGWAEMLVTFMMNSGLLPFSSILIEPLKILFFNNWLNHGFLLPLGLEQTKVLGDSVLFLLESNPGPGFGILMACFISRREKRTEMASGLVIQMFGGIHEIYFPYILSNLRLLAAAIAGGIVGNYCFVIFGCRLSGPASPGSILTILMMTDLVKWPVLLLGVGLSAAVSCLIACLILSHEKLQKKENLQKNDAEQVENIVENRAQIKAENMEKSKIMERETKNPVRIFFVCDAGMGSSAMACGLFKRKLKTMNLEQEIEVSHVSVDRIPQDAAILVCQKDFASYLPEIQAKCFQVESLMDMAGYEELFQWLKGEG